MTLYKVFYDVLADLADLFDAENHIGGHEAAQALRVITGKVHTPLLPAHQVLSRTIETALSLGPLPIAAKIAKAMPLIDWHKPGLESGKIRPDIANHMAVTELIGPDGMIFCKTVRVGLFVQSANHDYVARKHAAEESFIMIGGSAYWHADETTPRRCKPGDIIYHSPNTPHSSVTKDEPFIAAWRWTGEIGYDLYTLTG